MRLSVLATVISLSAVGLSLGADVQAAIRKQTDIPAQGLGPALQAFAKDRNLQIVYVSEEVNDLRTQGVAGDVTPDEALKQLLSGTDLNYRYLDEKTVTVFPAYAPTENSGGTERQQSQSATQSQHQGTEPKSLWHRLRLAQADTNSSQPVASPEPMALEEVIVTATKRPESVRKISGSVTAFTGAELEKLGAQTMADYLTRTPGVIFNGNTPGNSSVTIRGISTTTRIDQGQGTTGYFLDDVPLTDPFFSIAIPDIDAFDVDNVAVLRGPQGTLFGSASLGGAINYQTAKPDVSRWDMRVQATAAGVAHGGTGGSGKIMLNMPLVSDKFAVRGVYIYRDDPGFIDNIGTGKQDADRSLARGGRVQALWTPTADTRINYLFLNQTQDNEDSGYQTPLEAGKLKKNTVAPEFSRFETLIHNLRVDQDLGFATLTASAAYHEKTANSVEDATAELQSLFPGVSPITIAAPATSKGKTFEMRLASPAGRRLEYLVGIMRDDTRMRIVNTAQGPGAADFIENVLAPLFGLPPGIGELSAPNDVFLTALLPVRGEENALFGEATWHFNDRWKVTLGGRAFDTKIHNETIASGFISLLTSGELETHGSGTQKESGFTPKASITWTPSADFMAYALVNKGFRYGGPNIITPEPGFPVPPQFESDSLINYEMGARSNLFEQRLQLDGTLFYIDWSDIQLRQQTPLGLNFAANAGKATSYGFEGTGTWLMTRDLTFSTNLTYLNAELASDFSPGGGGAVVPDGSTLPGASKWQVASTLAYDWSDGPLEPSFVLAHRYISKAPGIFGAGAEQGDYHLLDARLSIRVNQVGITAFVSNLADSRGVTTASESPLDQFLVRPRTVGITFDYRL